MSAPSIELLRVVEHVHGHLGWLAAAALVHPAILLRNPRRRARLAVVSATTLATLAGTIGAWLYPSYRLHLKRGIFVLSMRLGWLFERKEHLAVAAIVLAWIGCLLHLCVRAPMTERDVLLAKTAHRAFVASAALAIAVAIFGTIVASTRTF